MLLNEMRKNCCSMYKKYNVKFKNVFVIAISGNFYQLFIVRYADIYLVEVLKKC